MTKLGLIIEKYHQVDGKPGMKVEQPSSGRIHGLTSYSPKPSVHQQLESTSGVAPKWTQEPENKLRPADGQIDSKHHLQGMILYS